jgi:hypothetical protein
MLLLLLLCLFFAFLMRPPVQLLSTRCIDSYEEKAANPKTSTAWSIQQFTTFRSLTVWFPKNATMALDIFNPVDTPSSEVMRIHVYVSINGEYFSLLRKPVVIDSQMASNRKHDLSAHMKPNCILPPNSVLVLQREYVNLEFSNLVSLEL